MGMNISRFVEIKVINKTQTITLKDPRIHFFSGRILHDPNPSVAPGSSSSCKFTNKSVFWGCNGILVYEAESFTLAIYFYNPIDYDKFSVELGLEVSPGKAHLGRLWATYSRMARGTYSSSDQDIKFTRVTADESHRSTQLSHGPIKVTATMVSETSSTLKVVLEEQRVSEEEAWGKNPWDFQEDESTSYEDEYDRLFQWTASKPLDGLQASSELRRRL